MFQSVLLAPYAVYCACHLQGVSLSVALSRLAMCCAAAWSSAIVHPVQVIFLLARVFLVCASSFGFAVLWPLVVVDRWAAMESIKSRSADFKHRIHVADHFPVIDLVLSSLFFHPLLQPFDCSC